jgi:hypothetical protein
MKMIKIHSKQLRGKAYYTPLVSFASILALGFICGGLIIPFAIAYASGCNYELMQHSGLNLIATESSHLLFCKIAL